VLVLMTPAGWVATLSGWYVTEIGRQPWLVTGILRTEEAVAAVPAPMVAGSLFLYLAVYVALMAAYVGALLYLARKACRAPEAEAVEPTPAPVALPGYGRAAPSGAD